jgi:hypothetical protein
LVAHNYSIAFFKELWGKIDFGLFIMRDNDDLNFKMIFLFNLFLFIFFFGSE